MTMSAKVFSAALVGLDGLTVEVEADVGRALPAVLVVGLPDTAVQESRERVRSAIKNSNLRFPTTKVTVNLAPGDVKKSGPLYDLPVALAILIAAGELHTPLSLERTMFLGELALDGALRPVNGVLPAALHARDNHFEAIVVPAANAEEAALVDGLTVYAAASLTDVVRHLIGEAPLAVAASPVGTVAALEEVTDFADIFGQQHAKRALEVAAAGGHNVRFIGPPGSGKTLLARALPGILPALTKDEMLEVTRIYSAAGLLGTAALVRNRPFRSPHHTTSHVALVGGGSTPRPGEVSLAHRGVLFLDELPEFPRQVLEALRQPLEDGNVVVARAAGTVTFPAQLTLVAAENPCPCGYATDTMRQCSCTQSQLTSYERRVSGPLLDRIDLHVTVPRVPVVELARGGRSESSNAVRERVSAARAMQTARQAATGASTNAELSSLAVRSCCGLAPDAVALMTTAADRFHLSARAYHRVLKVARTIADLAGSEAVTSEHVAEALQYRAAER